jgi:hypothetical protein
MQSDGSDGPPLCRLIVQLVEWTLGGSSQRTIELDFPDPRLLNEQLSAFEQRRLKCSRYCLHEFNNGVGQSIAFVDWIYVRHEVTDC